MIIPKYFFLHIILFLCFSIFSSAHEKPQTPNIPVADGNANKPQIPNIPIPNANASSGGGGGGPNIPIPNVNAISGGGGGVGVGGFQGVFAFGDSFTDTGNAYLSGGLKSFVGAFKRRVQNRHGAVQFPAGYRQCNGKLVVDFLCESLKIPYLPPYEQLAGGKNKIPPESLERGVNFAVAGSTALSGEFTKHSNLGHNLMWKGKPKRFDEQIIMFTKFMINMGCKVAQNQLACGAQTAARMANTLFWIGEMGRNDYARTFGSSISHQLLTKATVRANIQLVRTMLQYGAKYVVVQGLPPTGCCPLELVLSKAYDRDKTNCSSSANELIIKHNDLLQKELDGLRTEFGQATIVYVDYYGAYTTILENYQKFNFQEPFRVCCGSGGGKYNFNIRSLCGSTGASPCNDPEKYISWDGIHFTESMNKKLADLFFYQNFTNPPFQELLKKHQENFGKQ